MLYFNCGTDIQDDKVISNWFRPKIFPKFVISMSNVKVISTIEFDDHVMCLDNDDVCKS